MNSATVDRYLANSSYVKTIKVNDGELRVHKTGFEYGIEFFRDGEFSHIVEAPFISELDAFQVAIEIAAAEQ